MPKNPDFFIDLIVLVALIVSFATNCMLVAYIVKLKKDSKINPLSGLPKQMERRKNNDTWSVLYIDLNGFKEVNDVHGHYAGDVVIKKFGEFLQKLIRGTDTIERFQKDTQVTHPHGDEFIVFLDNASEEDAEKVKEKILSALQKEKFCVGDQCAEVGIGASIGIAIVRNGDYKKAIAEADAEMQKEKQKKGRR